MQEAAEKAVSDGASQVATAAAGEVKKQACALVEDGLVSIKDKELLGGLVAGAETAGVPSDITTPLRQIAEAGDQVPAESVTGPSGRLRRVARAGSRRTVPLALALLP